MRLTNNGSILRLGEDTKEECKSSVITIKTLLLQLYVPIRNNLSHLDQTPFIIIKNIIII